MLPPPLLVMPWTSNLLVTMLYWLQSHLFTTVGCLTFLCVHVLSVECEVFEGRNLSLVIVRTVLWTKQVFKNIALSKLRFPISQSERLKHHLHGEKNKSASVWSALEFPWPLQRSPQSVLHDGCADSYTSTETLSSFVRNHKTQRQNLSFLNSQTTDSSTS